MTPRKTLPIKMKRKLMLRRKIAVKMRKTRMNLRNQTSTQMMRMEKKMKKKQQTRRMKRKRLMMKKKVTSLSMLTTLSFGVERKIRSQRRSTSILRLITKH